jgi:Zn-dependent peptidase ImmA (M78 family)
MPFNPDMLRLARQRRGFQQQEAARTLGMEQSQLSRMENGVIEVRDDVLQRAARLYRVPTSFFSQQDPVYGAPVSVHPMWRRKADVSAKELDRTVAELNVRIMHIRRFLEGVGVANTNDLPRLDIEEYEDPERVAGLLRAHWKVPAGPIGNLTAYVEKAGVLVAHSQLGGASISGVTFAVPGLPPLIVLNNEQPADRLRFSLAHELGHLVMHRFPTPNMEQEAHSFAAALLMPAKDIRSYLRGKKIDLATLAALKPEWRVSMAGLLMAAHRAGAVDEGRNRYLWKQMSMKGYRLREPPDTDFDVEKPTLLASIFDMYMKSLGYSRDDLPSILHCAPDDLTEFYGPPNGEEPSRPRFTVVR